MEKKNIEKTCNRVWSRENQLRFIHGVNHYAPRLGLPLNVPVKLPEIQRAGAGLAMNIPLASDPVRRAKQIKYMRIQHPEWGRIVCIYNAGVRVDNYLISFSAGYDNTAYDSSAEIIPYFSITKLEEDGNDSFGIPLLHSGELSNSLMERASRMKYTVTTKNLCLVATNYLKALDIDPQAVSGNRLSIDTRLFHSSRGLVPSPLMWAYWGPATSRDAGDMLRNPGTNGVGIEVSAVNGQLLQLYAGNNCGSKALPLIKNFEKLYAIPDKQFLKYSAAERGKLLAKFATCPSLITPEAMQLGMILTTNPVNRLRGEKPRVHFIGH